VGLGKKEAKMVAAADELIGLVEETEFGIALPAALTAVRDEMDDVRGSLDKADAGAAVVEAEKQIETDLKALIGAMKQLPTTDPNNDRRKAKGKNGGREEQERQVNRLIAELKLVRLLQTRVNHGTAEVDKARAAAPTAVTAETRKKIEDLGGRQEDIRDVTERLANERSLGQP
jgi:septal ring factor EnvC (AmiA/AmiB activator)